MTENFQISERTWGAQFLDWWKAAKNGGGVRRKRRLRTRKKKKKKLQEDDSVIFHLQKDVTLPHMWVKWPCWPRAYGAVVTAVSLLDRLFTKEVQCVALASTVLRLQLTQTAQFVRFTTLDTIPAHIFYLTSRITLHVTAGSAAIVASRRPHVAGCCSPYWTVLQMFSFCSRHTKHDVCGTSMFSWWNWIFLDRPQCQHYYCLWLNMATTAKWRGSDVANERAPKPLRIMLSPKHSVNNASAVWAVAVL